MARTTTTPAKSTDDIRAELVAQILNAKPQPAAGTIGQRIAGFFGNRIADTGDTVAELAAGFTAAGRNYVVAKQSAELRQAQRTADRILAYQRDYQQ